MLFLPQTLLREHGNTRACRRYRLAGKLPCCERSTSTSYAALDCIFFYWLLHSFCPIFPLFLFCFSLSLSLLLFLLKTQHLRHCGSSSILHLFTFSQILSVPPRPCRAFPDEKPLRVACADAFRDCVRGALGPGHALTRQTSKVVSEDFLDAGRPQRTRKPVRKTSL